MNFILSPNLPSKKVRYAICDSRVDQSIKDELFALGLSLIYVSSDTNLPLPISAHPDIHFFHLDNNSFVTSKSFKNHFEEKLSRLHIEDCEIFNNITVSKSLGKIYPEDVLLNAVRLGNYLICNPKTVAEEIVHNAGAEIIPVKQGYTKCSIAVVSDTAIITDDVSIYNSLKNKIDVLLIEHGEVLLNGYNYGFIGGCTGKISNDILAFYGDLSKCRYANEIKSFCLNHSVHCISLANTQFYDYGSLIPIIED